MTLTWTEAQWKYVTDVLGVREVIRPAQVLVNTIEMEQNVWQAAGSWHNPLAVVTSKPNSPDQDQLLQKMLEAIGQPQALVLKPIMGSNDSEVARHHLLEHLKNFKGRALLLLGESSAELLYGQSLKPGQVVQYEGLSLMSTHSLDDLTQGPSAQITANKKTTWQHLKKLMQEI